MQVKLITLAFSPSLGGFDSRALDEFVSDKEVLAIREHFFEVHDQPYLACLVTWQVVAGSGATRDPAGRREKKPQSPRPHLAADLPEAARPLFESLRAWRLQRARSDGVPPFVVFSNRELAALARERPRSCNALLNIDGIG